MPPLEAKKLPFRMAAAERWKRQKGYCEEERFMFIDVRNAHLIPMCEEEVYVEPPEDFGRPGYCGRLKRWLYGMRKAATTWEEHYAAKFEKAGFVRGIAAPTVFYNVRARVRVVVHGDDFKCSGVQKELEKMGDKMSE